MSSPEREFSHEKPGTKPASFTCPTCQDRDDYQVRWILRTKTDRLPPGADERDRALFGKLRHCLIRVAGVRVRKRCQRTFEIPSQQAIVFV